jgi:hypothetical protein
VGIEPIESLFADFPDAMNSLGIHSTVSNVHHVPTSMSSFILPNLLHAAAGLNEFHFATRRELVSQSFQDDIVNLLHPG